MPAVVLIVPLFEESLLYSDLRGNEELFALKSGDETSRQIASGRSREYDLVPRQLDRRPCCRALLSTVLVTSSDRSVLRRNRHELLEDPFLYRGVPCAYQRVSDTHAEHRGPVRELEQAIYLVEGV